MSKFQFLLSACAAVLISLGAQRTSPAFAIAPEVRQTQQEAAAQDEALVAESHGWTPAEAHAHLHAAQVVGDIAAKVALNRRELFVGSVVSDKPREAPTLLIKGAADAYVHGLVDQADIAVVLGEGQPFSFDELQLRKERVREALEAQGYPSISVGINIAGRGAVHAVVARRANLPSAAATIVAELPSDLAPSVDLTVVDVPTTPSDLTSFGGMRIYNSADPRDKCTGGWTVQRTTDGLFGLVSAGHCDSTQNRETHIGDATSPHTLSYRARHIGQWGDVAWYTTNVGDQDDFYSDASTIRDVAGIKARASISLGETVCFYGRTSNTRDCSLEVLDVSETCTSDFTGGPIDNLVLMNGAGVADFGDSGGGFSLGGTAYGVMHGGCPPGHPFNNGAGWVAFSVADLTDEAIPSVHVYPGS